MDIEVERIIDARNGTLVSLSDEMILAIGKRYFELASGKEPAEETAKPLANDDLKLTEKGADVVKAAWLIKEYCNKRNCSTCPFSFLTTSTDLLYECCLREGNGCPPGKWVLPPKGIPNAFKEV